MKGITMLRRKARVGPQQLDSEPQRIEAIVQIVGDPGSQFANGLQSFLIHQDLPIVAQLFLRVHAVGHILSDYQDATMAIQPERGPGIDAVHHIVTAPPKQDRYLLNACVANFHGANPINKVTPV